MSKIIKLLKNKILCYVLSRYLVYGIQFLSLTLVANKLGTYNYGIWGFALLLISYLNIFNFGIGNSINVYIVQLKNRLDDTKDYIASSFAAVVILVGILVLISIIYTFCPAIIPAKYPLHILFYGILTIGALQYFNIVMSNIYRAQNRLGELAIYQSSIPIAVLICALNFEGAQLINALIISYIIAHAFSLSIFIFRKGYPRGGHVKVNLVKNIFKKGFFLFLYNACFYLILNSTSTLVSLNYTVVEYGMYSLSYTLGHSILLLMEAFTFIVFPKVVDRFYTGDLETIKSVITSIRTNYVTLAHGLIYSAIIFFPLIVRIFPNFNGALLPLNLMVLAIVLSTNSFGFNTLLIARNKEKTCASISMISLLAAIVIGLILAKVFVVSYYYMTFGIAISYIIFAILCSQAAQKLIYGKVNVNIIYSIFPRALIIPYLAAIIITIINISSLYFIPLGIYILLNRKPIKTISNTLKQIIKRPKFVDIGQ